MATSDDTVKAEEFEDSFEIEAEIVLIRATIAELTIKTTLVRENTSSPEQSGFYGHVLDVYAAGVAQNVFGDVAQNDEERRTHVAECEIAHPGWSKNLNPPANVRDAAGNNVLTAPDLDYYVNLEPALKELRGQLKFLAAQRRKSRPSSRARKARTLPMWHRRS